MSSIETKPQPTAAQQQEINDRFRNSRGGQVVLDPEGDASLAARGGVGGTIEANVAARDAALLAAGCDPRDPDATHLKGNAISGGPIVAKVDRAHFEPHYKPAKK